MKSTRAVSCLLPLALALAPLAACAPAERIAFAPAVAAPSRPPRTFEDVEMTYERPARVHTNVGRLEATGTLDRSLWLLRERAAELGLDGVGEIRCARAEASVAAVCSGTGFVWGGAQ